MKALIVTAVITLLAGCAGTGGYSSGGDTGAGASSRASDPLERDPVFNSWIN
jgi:hypothetical protein